MVANHAFQAGCHVFTANHTCVEDCRPRHTKLEHDRRPKQHAAVCTTSNPHMFAVQAASWICELCPPLVFFCTMYATVLLLGAMASPVIAAAPTFNRAGFSLCAVPVGLYADGLPDDGKAPSGAMTPTRQHTLQPSATLSMSTISRAIEDDVAREAQVPRTSYYSPLGLEQSLHTVGVCLLPSCLFCCRPQGAFPRLLLNFILNRCFFCSLLKCSHVQAHMNTCATATHLSTALARRWCKAASPCLSA